jgi:hypothetical protein
MKRLRLLVLAGAVAVALPLGLTTANATGGTGTKPSVSIDPYADYDFDGTNIDVKLYVRCTGTTVANVTLEQGPPETGAPITTGSGPQPFVACDGQRTHAQGVTVVGIGYDVGWAKATATVTSTPGGTTTVSRKVYIRHV